MVTIDGALGLLQVGNLEITDDLEGRNKGREGARVGTGTNPGELTHVRPFQPTYPMFHRNPLFITWSPPGFICSFNKYLLIQNKINTSSSAYYNPDAVCWAACHI